MKLLSSSAAFVLATFTLADTANAFVPSTTSSSSMVGTSSFVQRAPKPVAATGFHRNVASSGHSSPSPTALQMNLMDRFIRVAKGNLNNVLKNLEAPEKILNQAMIDMQSDLVKVRQSYAEITTSQRRLAKQRDAARARAEDWYTRAQLALRSGEDALAKEALARRQQHIETAASVQSQMDAQGQAADKLYQAMQQLEGKIQEAQQRKNEFIARAKAAESTQKVNDMLSGLTGTTSMDAFRRMQEKVEALEAAAEVSGEMAGLSALPESDLESEFALLESSAAVDEEFEKLKTKMLSGSKSATSSERRATKVFAPSVESEFDKLKAASPSVVKIPVTSDSSYY